MRSAKAGPFGNGVGCYRPQRLRRVAGFGHEPFLRSLGCCPNRRELLRGFAGFGYEPFLGSLRCCPNRQRPWLVAGFSHEPFLRRLRPPPMQVVTEAARGGATRPGEGPPPPWAQGGRG